MARHNNALIHWSQYLAARFAAMGVALFNPEANLRTAAAIGRVMHRFDGRHRQRARRHIAMCFPQYTEEQVDALVHKSFEHFIQLVVEIIHTPRLMTKDNWPNCTQLGNLGPTLQLLNSGKPVLMLTGHLGNWEVLGYYIALMGYRIDAIARPIDNPLINQWLLGIREAKGMRIITKWDATQRMLEVLDSGGALGFIADQNAGDRGLFVPFFGRLASSYKSIALLAMNQQVPVVCGYARRTGSGFTYDLGVQDIIHPEDWVDQPDPLFYITARYSRALEMMIRDNPPQYLWMHRRWKSRPRHEREGKAMPAALRKKLEALPWMDDDQMRQLEQPVAVERK